MDYYLGRGIFLLFIGLFLLELPNALEIILFLLVCGVAIVDIVVGRQELKARDEASQVADQAQESAVKQDIEKDAYNYGAPAAAPAQASSSLPDHYDPYAASGVMDPEAVPPRPGQRASQYEVQAPEDGSRQNNPDGGPGVGQPQSRGQAYPGAGGEEDAYP